MNLKQRHNTLVAEFSQVKADLRSKAEELRDLECMEKEIIALIDALRLVIGSRPNKDTGTGSFYDHLYDETETE